VNLFYILVRTFPFWAIPVGIALITAALRGKSGHKKKKFLYIATGLILLGGSAVFLIEQGHVQAVPFVHDIFHGQR
jgi:hypothetical protein